MSVEAFSVLIEEVYKERRKQGEEKNCCIECSFWVPGKDYRKGVCERKRYRLTNYNESCKYFIKS